MRERPLVRPVVTGRASPRRLVNAVVTGRMMPGPIDMRPCRPMEMISGKVHLQGGLCRKALPADTHCVQVGPTKKTFVKMTKGETWLLAAVTGMKAQNTSIQRTTLIETLRGYVEKACSGELKARDVDAPAAEEDPMNEVDDDQPNQPVKKRAKAASASAARVRYAPKSNHAKQKVLEVEVPENCPEVDPRGLETRTVSLFIIDRKQVWLCADDIDWAVRYLYAQNFLRGVPLLDPTDQGPGSPASTVLDPADAGPDTPSVDSQ